MCLGPIRQQPPINRAPRLNHSPAAIPQSRGSEVPTRVVRRLFSGAVGTAGSAGSPLDAVILVSDGRNNAGLAPGDVDVHDSFARFDNTNMLAALDQHLCRCKTDETSADDQCLHRARTAADALNA